VEGLKLDILGGATGDRGAVNYSQGFAYLLDKLADRLLGSNGPLKSRTEGLNRSIEDIGDRRNVLTRRLEDAEKRYRAQFGALDGLLGKLRKTSDFLTQQLANLPGAFGSKG
jgi:flagellar hook-associated protein 2